MFTTIETAPDKLIFNEKVRDLCRSCKRYGKSATCPPYLETIDYYKKAAVQYKNLDIIYKEFFLLDYKDVIHAGRESSLELHNYLLSERKEKMDNGILFVTCYGGGSCKMCKQCVIPCCQPQKALSPLEATGVDVFSTLAQFKIILPTLVEESFYRVGAILYD